MCLGELAEVIELTGPAGAVVSGDNRLRAVSLLALDGPVTPGDWVVIHSGFALSRLTPDQGREARDLRRSAVPERVTRGSG